MCKKYIVGCKWLDEYARGKVVFNNRPFAVPHFLPGEKGEIELVFHASETSARLVSIDKASEDRVETDCPVYEACGGCQMMHMKYEKQLEWKQSRIEELFCKEKEEGKIAPIIPMEQPWNYRHKIYASFGTTKKGEVVAGIYEENSHKVVQTKSCRIQHELANKMIEEIKSAKDDELQVTIEKWFEQTRNQGIKMGAGYMAAAVAGVIDKHLKKGGKPSLRDYERCFKDVYKIVSVQLNAQQNDLEGDND